METLRDESLVVPREGAPGRLLGVLRRNAVGLPSLPLGVWVAVFVLVPAGFMIANSFMTYTFYDVELPWTTKNWEKLVHAGSYFKMFRKTVFIALMVTVITLIISSPFSYYVARLASKRLGVLILILTVLPLWMNAVIRNYAWMSLIEKNGVLITLFRVMGVPEFDILFTMELVIVVGISLTLPFGVLVLYATMSGISHEVEEASLDLGSNRFHSFRKVILPLSSAGYQTAALLIFMPTLAFYVTPQMLGGADGAMLATALVPVIKDSLDFANGSAFMIPIIATLIVTVMILRRGMNIENIYRGGIGSQIARRTERRSKGLATYCWLLLGFTYLPMASMIFFSFGESVFGALPMTGVTLHWYKQLMKDTTVMQSLQNSLIIAVEVAVVGIGLCAPAAYAVVRHRFFGRRSFLFITILPMLISELILGMAILILLVTFKVPLSLQTIALGHVTLALPFIFLTILAQQQGYDRAIEEASRDLGSTVTKTFFRVVLPLMVPGLIAAAFLAITISFNDFVVAFMLTGGELTLPLYIFGLTKGSVTPTINALGALLIAAIVLLAGVRLLQPWALVAHGIRRARLILSQASSV